jgi:hypothetical protein
VANKITYKGWTVWHGPKLCPATGWPVGDPLWQGNRFGVNMCARTKQELLDLIDYHITISDYIQATDMSAQTKQKLLDTIDYYIMLSETLETLG